MTIANTRTEGAPETRSRETATVICLRGGGVSLVLDCRTSTPTVLHWGEDLGSLDDEQLAILAHTAIPGRLHAAPDSPRRFSLLPTEADAWSGRPAIMLSRAGRRLGLRLRTVAVEHHPADAEADQVTLLLQDAEAQVEVVIRLELDRDGILTHSLTVRSLGGTDALQVECLHAALPLPERAMEILDFSGRWLRERAPQRLPIVFGSHSREQRRGKPGHDTVFLTVTGTRGFRNRTGEVWAMHVAWSGDQGAYVERLPEGAGALTSVLSGGELLRSGEVRLHPGEEYLAPDVMFAWSEAGLDGLSHRFHSRLRARPGHPRRPRPMVLNTWEAVFFDHDQDTLIEMADRAADAGIERFVVDDGWFHGRRDDTAGLGDWWVDQQVWPQGLHPLVDHVRRRGMEFGLWFEPEMVNPDSDAARAHPEWLLTKADAEGWPTRHQHVLDLTREDAYAYILDRMDWLIAEYRIDYVKWDHNRDLIESIRPAADGIIGPHAQTLAVYRLIDELRRRHPALEIETCSGGGARVDLGMLSRTDRVWPSDCTDPVERVRIQRWTSLLLPFELIAAHVADAQSGSTGRSSSFGFRSATSLFGHAGTELNLTQGTPGELAEISRFTSLYKEFRDLIHSGSVVNADLDDPATMLHGVVSADLGHALFSWSQLETSAAERAGRTLFPGLDPDAVYLVRLRDEPGGASRRVSEGPAWFDAAREGLRISGAVAGRAGLPMPSLDPGSAALIEFRRLAG
jgi:alpha-galactosidase